MRTIRHILASQSDHKNRLDGFLAQSLVSVPCMLPQRKRLPSMMVLVRYLIKKVRLQIDDENNYRSHTMLERLGGKEIEMAIDHRPCFTPAKGMVCIMNKEVPFYMDGRFRKKI